MVVPIGAGGVSREPLRGTVERPTAFGQFRKVETTDLHRVVTTDDLHVALILRDGFTLVLARGVASIAADMLRKPTHHDVVEATIVAAAEVGTL